MMLMVDFNSINQPSDQISSQLTMRSKIFRVRLQAGAFTFRRVRKKQVSPILLILAAAALGMAVF